MAYNDNLKNLHCFMFRLLISNYLSLEFNKVNMYICIAVYIELL